MKPACSNSFCFSFILNPPVLIFMKEDNMHSGMMQHASEDIFNDFVLFYGRTAQGRKSKQQK